MQSSPPKSPLKPQSKPPFKPHLSALKSYESGKPIELVVREFGIKPSEIIKLASNENPLGAPKAARKAIKKEAKNAFRYPDDSMFELKSALAEKFGVGAENLIITHGSDQAIELVVNAIATSAAKVLMSAATFAMYEIYARQHEARILRTKSAIHEAGEFIAEIRTQRPEIVFLCVPNNPLGDCLKNSEVCEILEVAARESPETFVVLDCAYGEFAAFKGEKYRITPSDIVAKYKNCIYLGTFSKLYGLGGLRVGYGIADSSVISLLSKLRAPFNVANISLKAAAAALKDESFVEKTLKNNAKQMRVFENFAEENGLDFIESFTNFITILLPSHLDSSLLCDFLLKNGVIIRDLKGYGFNAIRVTVGLDWQNRAVLKLIKKFLKNT